MIIKSLKFLFFVCSTYIGFFFNLDRDKVDELAKSIMEGTSHVTQNMTSKTVAEQIAEKLNMKLNYTKQENVAAADEENFKVFEEELEINDFPQQVNISVNRILSSVRQSLD